MPSDVAIAPNGDLYIADMHHNRVRKVDAKTHIISTVAGSGAWGNSGDDGPATQARLAGPAGIARGARAGRHGHDLHRRLLQRPRPRGRPRRHHPRRQRRGRESRSARRRAWRSRRRRGWLYVADSSRDRDRAAEHPADRARTCWRSRRPPVAAPRRRRRGRADERLSGRCSRGRCRSCGRTADAVALLVGAAARRSRRSARCSRGRSRSSSTTCSAGIRCRSRSPAGSRRFTAAIRSCCS